MTLSQVNRVARQNYAPKVVEAVKFLRRQTRRQNAPLYAEAGQFVEALAAFMKPKDVCHILFKFNSMWADFCYDHKIDETRLHSYK